MKGGALVGHGSRRRRPIYREGHTDIPTAEVPVQVLYASTIAGMRSTDTMLSLKTARSATRNRPCIKPRHSSVAGRDLRQPRAKQCAKQCSVSTTRRLQLLSTKQLVQHSRIHACATNLPICDTKKKPTNVSPGHCTAAEHHLS